ncbi:MAG TPA: MDR family oxidoreductase [Bacillota bacterium]|nr:MDR family oxidoreductase [Bacillota bacterium]
MFKALVLEEGAPGQIRDLEVADLPEGDVLVRVQYSSLNYKDGMALAGRRGIVRRYPMVPGIDLAGTVAESASPMWKPGDAVLATGWGLGEDHWGGYAQMAKVRAEWLVPLPAGLSPERAMALGTAGFTAMLSVMALQAHGVKGDVAVTGASGGVGGIAVALLARAGYRVAASTGRPELADYLRGLGAAEIVDRAQLAAPTRAALERERWAGAVDTVGGDTLAALLRATARDGCVAACGLAGGSALQTTVYPFILRGVTLAGIDSNYCPRPQRLAAWERLAREMPADLLDGLSRTVKLAEVHGLAEEILSGRVRGRVVVAL